MAQVAPLKLVTGDHLGDEDVIIARALEILERRLPTGPMMGEPRVVRDYLVMRAARHSTGGREVFGVMFLDSQCRLIETQDLFYGSLETTAVYPRVVVQRAIELRASAVIFTHNHPSGILQPSRADETLTQTLKSALALVEVRVLDHIITGGHRSASMAELGLI